ncbi:hypothetical protein [Aeromicrobium sp. P5_D10]
MAKESRAIDPLGPLDAATRILVGVLVTFTALAVMSLASGEGHWFGIGEDPICRTPNFLSRDSQSEMCQNDPSAMQQVWTGLTAAPSFLLFVGLLLLARHTIKYARRVGLFSAALAERIEAFGWLLLIGLAATTLLEWFADGMLKHSMASTMSWHSGSFSVSIAGIIGAYGIIAVGRVMSRAAVMHADLEGTV